MFDDVSINQSISIAHRQYILGTAKRQFALQPPHAADGALWR